MSCYSFLFMTKKLKELLPSSSKKAWKSLTSSISPKLHNLHHLLNNKVSKPVSKTASRLLNRHSYHHHHQRRSYRRRCSYRKKQCQQYIQQPSTVYVDKLYENINNSSSSSNNSNSNSNNNNNNNNDNNKSGVSSNNDIGNETSNNISRVKWKEYMSKLPTIRGVDERADEFIVKFRQQMQLQREQSIIELQEMLARST